MNPKYECCTVYTQHMIWTVLVHVVIFVSNNTLLGNIINTRDTRIVNIQQLEAYLHHTCYFIHAYATFILT